MSLALCVSGAEQPSQPRESGERDAESLTRKRIPLSNYLYSIDNSHKVNPIHILWSVPMFVNMRDHNGVNEGAAAPKAGGSKAAAV